MKPKNSHISFVRNGLTILVLMLTFSALPVFSQGNGSPGSATQESEKSTAPTSGNSGNETQPAGETEYLPLLNQWKEKEVELKKLEAEYIAADQARKNQIRTDYNRILDEARTVVADLRAKAIEAYEKQPNEDPVLVRLLVGMLTDDLHKKKYDDFFKLGEILIKGKIDVAHIQALHNSKRLVEPINSTALDEFAVADYINELISRHNDAMKNNLPRVVIKTSHGDITLELFEDSAPNHVANFISLAEKNYYDGSKFHRVVSNPPVAQGGIPKDGKKIEYTLAPEWNRPDRRLHFKGHVGAARTSDPNSASSEFYIARDRAPNLDLPGNSYTVFGRVIEGMAVVHQIKQDDEMISVRVIRKREHPYVPKPYDPAAADPAAKDAATKGAAKTPESSGGKNDPPSPPAGKSDSKDSDASSGKKQPSGSDKQETPPGSSGDQTKNGSPSPSAPKTAPKGEKK